MLNDERLAFKLSMVYTEFLLCLRLEAAGGRWKEEYIRQASGFEWLALFAMCINVNVVAN